METFDTIAARRNVRTYVHRPIPAADLDRILEAARRTPSASNRQWWDMVVVTERDELEALAGVWRGAGHIASSAATIVIVAPITEDPMLHDLLLFDLGQLAMAICLAATDLGIGSGHAAVGDQALARQLMNIPEDRFCAALIALGYPAEGEMRPLKRHNRRPLEDVVHRGKW
jgi:nitroreductase